MPALMHYRHAQVSLMNTALLTSCSGGTAAGP